MQAMKKVEAKNALENYAYQLRNSVRDDKVSVFLLSFSATTHAQCRGSISSPQEPAKGVLHRNTQLHGSALQLKRGLAVGQSCFCRGAALVQASLVHCLIAAFMHPPGGFIPVPLA